MAANSVAEGVGLGATFILGGLAAPLLESRPAFPAVFLTAFLAIVLGTFLEGVIVGLVQGVVLHRRAPIVPLCSWVVATSVGAGLAWLVGMIPSTFMALATSAPAEASLQEPAVATQLLLATALGLATGPILGVAQWVVLRRRFAGAASWLWANALAWGLGMPVIFAGMDSVPWEGPLVLRWTAIFAVCFFAGLIVGAVHGRVLVRMTRSSSQGAAVV